MVRSLVVYQWKPSPFWDRRHDVIFGLRTFGVCQGRWTFTYFHMHLSHAAILTATAKVTAAGCSGGSLLGCWWIVMVTPWWPENVYLRSELSELSEYISSLTYGSHNPMVVPVPRKVTPTMVSLHDPSMIISLSFHFHSPQSPITVEPQFWMVKSQFCTPKQKTVTCAEAFFYFNGNRFDVAKSRSDLRQRTRPCQVGKNTQCLSGIL